VTPKIESNIRSLKGGGQPLPKTLRHFFEPRFGRDFSDVRVHNDSFAGKSARAVNAKAYTVGYDVVFGTGQFAPETFAGKQLLAHELTHVMQQRPIGSLVQTTYGSKILRKPASTKTFKCPDYAGDTKLEACLNDLDRLKPGDRGPSVEKVQKGLVRDRISVGPKGADGKYGSDTGKAVMAFKKKHSLGFTQFPDVGPGTMKKLDDLCPPSCPPCPSTAPRPAGCLPCPSTAPKCGPDATGWFVLQVNTAMGDLAVLAIKADLATANAIARRYGITAALMAEGGAATAIELQEAKLRLTGPAPPARSGAIVGQMAAGTAARTATSAALTTAIKADPLNAPRIISDFTTIALLVKKSALAWKVLVDHGARYDFKAHTDSMRFPSGASCPEKDCPPGEVGIITLCPGIIPESCYESDLPGNLFYALIGRHIGWSELTLQLGSQLAELTDVTPRPARPAITWDTPDDTAAISLGFRLPLPLTAAALCGMVSPARGTLALRSGCKDCLDLPKGIVIK
jgi:peptidoglycan hydrolase-like protein with peptidoglycan-binding domain